jgi:hypothetical protein
MTATTGKIGWIDMTVDNAEAIRDSCFCAIRDPAGATAALYQP